MFYIYEWFLWQIGRIPNEWARCLLPLVRDKKVRIEGRCKSAPEALGIMDAILLSVRYTHRLFCLDLIISGYFFEVVCVFVCLLFVYSVYINSSMFQKHSATSLKVASNTADESIFHPLPNLLRLLGLTPFKKVMDLPRL